MKKVISLILILAMLACFCGCTAEETPGETANEGITLNVYNWGQYIADGSDDSLDIIAEFESRYPWIHVNYSTI